jgi:Protein of unknown function (DUF1579)
MTTEQKDCGCSAPSQSDCEAAMMEMGKPAAELKFVEPLIGTWDAEVKMWMGPGEPMVSKGVMVNDWVLGGRWLRHAYRGDENFEGSGYFGFNKTTGKFEGLWIDTMLPMMQSEAGDYDERTATFNMSSESLCPMTKEPVSKRSVVRIESPDRHVMEMYFSSADEPEGKGMEIVYTRRA